MSNLLDHISIFKNTIQYDGEHFSVSVHHNPECTITYKIDIKKALVWHPCDESFDELFKDIQDTIAWLYQIYVDFFQDLNEGRWGKKGGYSNEKTPVNRDLAGGWRNIQKPRSCEIPTKPESVRDAKEEAEAEILKQNGIPSKDIWDMKSYENVKKQMSMSDFEPSASEVEKINGLELSLRASHSENDQKPTDDIRICVIFFNDYTAGSNLYRWSVLTGRMGNVKQSRIQQMINRSLNDDSPTEKELKNGREILLKGMSGCGSDSEDEKEEDILNSMPWIAIDGKHSLKEITDMIKKWDADAKTAEAKSMDNLKDEESHYYPDSTTQEIDRLIAELKKEKKEDK